MENLKTYLVPLGRLLMSGLFIWAGIGKVRFPGGNAEYFAAVHVPAPEVMVWIVAIFEIVFGVALLVGFQTRWAAAGLAIFCLITGFAVHLPVGDLANMIQFYKNLAMTGGLLYAVAYGAGGISVDGKSA